MFESMVPEGYEQVVFCHDRYTGLRSIIVIHDTTLGPALGGVRMVPYSSDDEALVDCLRLARAMTLKAAAAGVHLGGGKSVVIADPRTDKTEAMLRAHGRFIQSLGGRYIPGIDVGTEQADMDVLAFEVARVSCNGEDPSPNTALGVLEALRAGVTRAFERTDLAGIKVAVQGAGHVGAALAGFLVAEGAKVTICDVDPTKAELVARDVGADIVEAPAIYDLDVDVFAPCALGAVVNDDTLPRLKCGVVAGAANNVLQEPRHASELTQRGIVYVPDYYANGGGLIFVEEELLGHSRAQRERRIRQIYRNVLSVFDEADRYGITTDQAGERLALARLRALQNVGPRQVNGTPQPYAAGGPTI